MSKPEYLFCEGNKESLDRQILEKITREVSSYPMVANIIPSGGKGNLPNFILGYLTRVGVRNLTESNYIGFRDRDFDSKVPDGPPQISKSQNPRIIFSYRTTIENYLLDPEIFYKFILENKLGPQTGIHSLSDAVLLFSESAEKIKVYTAVRWALGNMREPIKMKTTWTRGSGYLPDSLTEEDCLYNAIQHIQDINTQFERYTSDRFQSYYHSYLSTFDENFFQNQDYLTWFHGKDLKETIRTSERLRTTNFSFKAYETFALSQFDFRRYPDLIQLFDVLSGTVSLDDINTIV